MKVNYLGASVGKFYCTRVTLFSKTYPLISMQEETLLVYRKTL